jgi:hypothetical protein
MHIFQFFALVGFTTVAMLVGAMVCHLVPRRVADAFCRAPGLDVVITYFTVLPLIYGPIVAGWRGLLAVILGRWRGC